MTGNEKAAPVSRTGSGSEQLSLRLDCTPTGLRPQDAFAQRQRVLARLYGGPATTIELRRDEDVMHPAARVMERRRIGHRITTAWTHAETEGGERHRVGLYALRSGGA